MVIGFTYGMLMAVTPTFIGEFFGKPHFGGNWALLRTSPGVGSFLFSTVLAGSIYQRYNESKIPNFWKSN